MTHLDRWVTSPFALAGGAENVNLWPRRLPPPIIPTAFSKQLQIRILFGVRFGGLDGREEQSRGTVKDQERHRLKIQRK